MRLLAPALVLILLAAGCVTPPEGGVEGDGAVDATAQTLSLADGSVLHSSARRGGLSYFHYAEGAGEATFTFPEGVLVQDAEGRLVPATEPVMAAVGSVVSYLPPYGATNLTVDVGIDGAAQTLALAPAGGEPLFSGDLAVELMAIQRDQFPHRSPGQPSYAASIEYFAKFFQELGYEVEVNQYGGPVLPVGDSIGPDSLASVVAYKRGTTMADRYLGFGGHFDVVEQTTEGAFDNTAGTVATLAMAKAFANVTTQRSLFFGVWGGEEDGILGSQAWVSQHPELVPFIDGYVNFDVTGIAWPAPKVEPSPIVVAAGPDGAATSTLHQYAQQIEETWLRSGAEFVYEGVAQGQATGAGVNAQSDHTPFMARGIPVYFQFTGRVDDVFAVIHSEVDTLDNLTVYSLKGIEALVEGAPEELTAEERAEGEWYLARSFETQMGLGFYWAVLTDAGVLPVARTPVQPPVPSTPLLDAMQG